MQTYSPPNGDTHLNYYRSYWIGLKQLHLDHSLWQGCPKNWG